MYRTVFLAPCGLRPRRRLGRRPSQTLVIGSKIDTEGSLLGKMIVRVLTAHGIPVSDKTGFGTTDIVRKAIMAGEIDVYRIHGKRRLLFQWN